MDSGCNRQATGHRPPAQAALDAPSTLALRTSGQDRAPAALGPHHTPCGLWDDGPSQAGAHGMRLVDQHRVHRGATRWSKGSCGFRVDREVMSNLVTQFAMRVRIPPSRCRSDSVSPRPATGPQRSEAGINGGPWKPPSGYPVSQASMGSASKGVVEPPLAETSVRG